MQQTVMPIHTPNRQYKKGKNMTLVQKTISLSLVLLVTACGTPSVDDLVQDPELLVEVMEECQAEMMQDELSEKCQNAKKAMAKMGNNMMKNMLGGF